MTARWTYIGPPDPRQAVAGKVPPAGFIRQAWAAAWVTQGVLLGCLGAAATHAAIDTVTVLRATYAVVVDGGDVKVVKEWRR